MRQTHWGRLLAPLVAVVAALTGWGAQPAQALQVKQVMPQGVVNEVRQVVLQTDADAIPLGDTASARVPVRIQCGGVTPEGSARWTGPREWVWQFAQPVAAGVRCTVTLDREFRSRTGAPLKGAASYGFEVAGPSLLDVWPGTYVPIDEEQIFVLRLNAPALRDSLLQHTHCRAEGVGERIPVRWVDTAQRTAVLTHLGLRARADREDRMAAGAGAATAWPVLACNRRLAADARVQLVYGAGVRTPQGVTNRKPVTLDFQVRKAFTAQMLCEREKAGAGCLPIRPVVLEFSAPVPHELARQVRLTGPGGKDIRPVADVDGPESSDSSTSDRTADDDATVQRLQFPPPFEPLAAYRLHLPAGVRDDAGRDLANAAAFPLTVQIAEAPVLAKFGAAPFGVIERFAEKPSAGGGMAAALPVTLRRVEGFSTPPAASHRGLGDTAPPAAQVRSLLLQDDAAVIHWWNLVHRYDEGHVNRDTALRDLAAPLPAPVDDKGADADFVPARTLSLLRGQPGVQPLLLPQPRHGEPRPMEVVGIPLRQPGFHVVEIESPALGAALLDERLGPSRSMYVRTSALVTNLGVHFKQGREGALVWVTTLDQGRPVPQARVQVSDCNGRVHASGTTDSQGLLRLPQLEDTPPSCRDHAASGNWFISARAHDAGMDDMAFVWSDWQRGIEPWRFDLATGWRGWRSSPDGTVAHTVMDRTLVRAGETVSMKHFVRRETASGLDLPEVWPGEAVITHQGSGQDYILPLVWHETPTGGRNANSQFAVPPAAKLGTYTVQLRWSTRKGDTHPPQTLDSGQFRVEAFRLPVLSGSVQPQGTGGAALVQPGAIPVQVSLQYLNGGSASGQAVQISALLSSKTVEFDRWPGYSFSPPQVPEGEDGQPAASDAGHSSYSDDMRLLADKLPLTLDAHGQGQVALPELPAIATAQELRLEASFADPGGEIQTLTSTHTVWPASVVPGIRMQDWISVSRKLPLQVLAVDTRGQPQAGVPLTVQAVLRVTTSTRKRLVGGFYSYDNQYQYKPLGTVCSGKSDPRGLLLCEAALHEAGEVELIVTAQDSQGRRAQAAGTVWVTRHGELWFGGQDHDRMDLLPAQPAYAPGDTARLQVRMPFREATALLTVEREGILHAQVLTLKGSDPTVELPIQPGWGPNIYVSVLALRGRLHDVPWYSFFTWGYKAPRAWWHAWRSGSTDYVAPTALVDLSKPAFRLGVAELRIADPAHQLTVQVTPDKTTYQPRDRARLTIRATRADGTPAAGAEVAIAAVDQALLELWPNTSWALHEGLWLRRGWHVATATAQMEIVGRRHYGRKAAPPGGGGGHAPTRELLDTLLLWQPSLTLDAQGQAQLDLPLNDALTSFTIAAVADTDVQRFGTGTASIRTTQDLQLISGLPSLVREGDRFQASITVRNTTAQPMSVRLTPQVQELEQALEPRSLDIPAHSAREAVWDVQVPPQTLPHAGEAALHWTLQARDQTSGASDALHITQRLLPAVPLAVQQSMLVQLDRAWTQAVVQPAGAMAGQGGVRLDFSDRLADAQQGIPGLRAWWRNYPHTCLEQTTARAIGLGDIALWERAMQQLPTYLDDDGLTRYFPQQEGRPQQGSDALTAHLLAVTHELAKLDPRFALPVAERERMERALAGFVTGRIQPRHWSPRNDLDVRKLAAIAALARTGKATPAMLDSVRRDLSSLPTHAVIDWVTILQHMPALPLRDEQLASAWQTLSARLTWQGSRISFATEEQDHWWWLMQDTNSNAARLLLATVGTAADQRQWDADRPRLVAGLLARQRDGAWGTTAANTWAELALRHFSHRYEAQDVTGLTTAALHTAAHTVDWTRLRQPASVDGTNPGGQPPSPSGATSGKAPELDSALQGGAFTPNALPPSALFLPWGTQPRGELRVQHQGTGKPWAAIQTIAAVPRTQPLDAGYAVRKTVIRQSDGARNPQDWRRGDILRVELQVLQAHAGMTWVALTDPIPAGATILGSGLGRDSAIATRDETPDGHDAPWQDEGPAFIERGQDSYRAYWAYLPAGSATVSYTLRLNQVGEFALPATRVEALYAPDIAGELPNPRVSIRGPQP